MKRFLVALALFVLTPFARADIPPGTLPHFTCTLATQNTDGTTIPASGPGALTAWSLYLDGSATAAHVSTTLPLVCDWQMTAADNPVIGVHTAQATDSEDATFGGESARSNSVSFTITAPLPGMPAGCTVLANNTRTPTLSCTKATTNTWGEALPGHGSALASTKFYLDGSLTAAKTIPIASGAQWALAATDVTVGNHTYQASHIDVAGGEGVKSASVPFTVSAPPAPKSPTGLSVSGTSF